MDGLRVEQNTWRVVAVKDGEVTFANASASQMAHAREKVTEEKPAKLLD